MSWARLDDRYDDHPKVRAVWRRSRAAAALHVHAITYCARHETDGHITRDWIEDRIPNARERDAALEALLDTGLFDANGDGGFIVHDYLDFNPSRAEASEKRRKDSERKAKGRANRVR